MVREDRLSGLFRATGGSGRDPLSGNNAGLEYMQSDSDFLKNFNTPSTGANGSGPILNANANLLPTIADQYRDNADKLDFKLGNGLGISRPYRKNDSIGGNTETGFYGYSEPSKMFGRNSKSYDLNYNREEMTQRAYMNFKSLGYKPNEVPLGGDLQPWQWNDNQALGIGGGPIGNSNQYNRNHSLPDADAVGRRLYQPAPSRLTKMIQTDVETAALTPQRTLLNPIKVVSEDRQRMKLQRVPRNADVIESVLYHNIEPRGMGRSTGAPKVWADPDVLRQPIGSNDTGTPVVHDRWGNPYSSTQPLLDATNEDLLIMTKNTMEQVRGHKPELEAKEYRKAEIELMRQKVDDYNHINPRQEEFPHNASGLNRPLVPAVGVGSEF